MEAEALRTMIGSWKGNPRVFLGILRGEMARRKWSLRDVALELGCSAAAVCLWFKKHRLPRAVFQRKFAEIVRYGPGKSPGRPGNGHAGVPAGAERQPRASRHARGRTART